MQFGHVQTITKQGRQRGEKRASRTANISYRVVTREHHRALGIRRRCRQDRLLQRLRCTAIRALRIQHAEKRRECHCPQRVGRDQQRAADSGQQRQRHQASAPSDLVGKVGAEDRARQHTGHSSAQHDAKRRFVKPALGQVNRGQHADRARSEAAQQCSAVDQQAIVIGVHLLAAISRRPYTLAARPVRS